MSQRAREAERGLRGLREGPEQATHKPMRMNESLCLTIMKDAWKAEGLDLEDPAKLDQYWFEEDGFVVVDLRSRRGNR